MFELAVHGFAVKSCSCFSVLNSYIGVEARLSSPFPWSGERGCAHNFAGMGCHRRTATAVPAKRGVAGLCIRLMVDCAGYHAFMPARAGSCGFHWRARRMNVRHSENTAMQIEHQCANDACDCHVKKIGDYCSDTCRQQTSRENADLDVCDCQHVDCGASAPETPGNSG